MFKKNTIGRRFAPILIMCLCLLLPLLAGVSKADNGPKQSITVNVKNAPELYFIALLKDDGSGGGIKDNLERSLNWNRMGNRDRDALRTLFDYNVGGWKLHVPPVGDSYFRADPSGSYTWGYTVPTLFRVIIVTLDGEVIVSTSVRKESYNAVFEYDVATGELIENIRDSRLLYAANVITCYLLTLLIEGAIFAGFRFSGKKNWMHFFIINTITQIILNFYLVCNVTEGTQMFGVLIGLIMIELLIFIIEALYYSASLRGKDGKLLYGRSFGYAFTANLASFLLGILLFETMWMTMFDR